MQQLVGSIHCVVAVYVIETLASVTAKNYSVWSVRCWYDGTLIYCCQGGNYVVNLLDTRGAPISILFICFLEAMAISWFYGERVQSACA